MPSGVRSNTSRTASSMASSGTTPVRNVSIITDTGCATPMAYATCASHREASCAATTIFAAEGPAAVTRHATVGVHDDLAAGQAGVALRAPDHETTGRVDEDIRIGDLEARVREHRPDHERDHTLAQLHVVDLVRVLGGHYHLTDPDRPHTFVHDAD